jgi:hypothetical protein
MKARLIGPEEELGEVYKPLDFFGHKLTKEWSDINPTPAQLEKLKANRYVELKGLPAKAMAPEDAAAKDATKEAEAAEAAAETQTDQT